MNTLQVASQTPLFTLFTYQAREWKPRGKPKWQKAIPDELRTARERADQLYTPILSLRMVHDRTIERTAKITSPADAYQLVKTYYEGLVQEHMIVLTMNIKNVVIAVIPVYVGSVHTAVVRIAEVVRPAILTNATGLILCHNHPSGDPTPSPEDAAITREINKACALLDIDLLDHLVIGDEKFTSLKERGLGF